MIGSPKIEYGSILHDVGGFGHGWYVGSAAYDTLLNYGLLHRGMQVRACQDAMFLSH